MDEIVKLSCNREDDSIPLADGDPADFVEDSLVSEDKRKVGLVNIIFWSINKRNTKLLMQEFEWRKKVWLNSNN